MNYKDYYQNLTKLETNLFEEGYWKFHPPYNNQGALVFSTIKFTDMVSVLGRINAKTISGVTTHKIITEKQVKAFMRNPKKYLGDSDDDKYYYTTKTYVKKDGTLSHYRHKSRLKRRDD